jgi:hypothetical protein
MGQKLCVGSNDTPWATFSCNVIQVNRSTNVDIDLPDGDVEEEKTNERSRVCCFSWLPRPKKENEMI